MLTISKHANTSSVTPITENLDGWMVIAGKPTMKTWVMHTSEDGSMMSGYWEATPGNLPRNLHRIRICPLN